MKRIVLGLSGLVLLIGLNGCTDAEMAEVNKDINEGIQNTQNMQQMQRDCKNYVASKFTELPMAAIQVNSGYGSNSRFTIPVSINWDEPRVEETGNCTIVNGIVKSYKGNY